MFPIITELAAQVSSRVLRRKAKMVAPSAIVPIADHLPKFMAPQAKKPEARTIKKDQNESENKRENERNNERRTQILPILFDRRQQAKFSEEGGLIDILA